MALLSFSRIVALGHRLKRQLRPLAWQQYNNLRYRYPAPKRAQPFSASAPEAAVEVLWQAPAPPSQTLKHSLDFLDVGEIVFTTPYVLSITGGRVVGKRGDVVTPEGTIFTDISPEIPRRAHHHFLLNRGNMPSPTRLAGTVAVLNGGAHSNYFHFLFDTLARLRFLNQLDLPIDYYCVAQHQPFQGALVSLFGLEASKIIPLEKHTHLEAQQLIATALPGDHQNQTQVHLKDAATYRFVRDTVLATIDRGSTQYAPRIYVQRKTKRIIANEEALLQTLKALGDWQVVRLEEHSALEQAAIFHHAEVVVALHGAGLANTVYCRPGAHVVEIFSPVLLEAVYYQIAQQLDLQHHPIIAAHSQTSRTPDGHLYEQVTVEVSIVRQCLESYRMKTM